MDLDNTGYKLDKVANSDSLHISEAISMDIIVTTLTGAFLQIANMVNIHRKTLFFITHEFIMMS